MYFNKSRKIVQLRTGKALAKLSNASDARFSSWGCRGAGGGAEDRTRVAGQSDPVHAPSLPMYFGISKKIIQLRTGKISGNCLLSRTHSRAGSCPGARVTEVPTRTTGQSDPVYAHRRQCVLIVLDDHAPYLTVNVWHPCTV
ncbi:hypothetical protein AVEN_58330-1 [Araneus ventricosus]|uniref:Uncharacterized protein n=1 Tax=Araneus ventricosus TaxID=182803 RepID=A0A4Y2CQ56_ARAVE|nr:hypothetical protein AVEN_58330-1 [Araneus ventricosus]